MVSSHATTKTASPEFAATVDAPGVAATIREILGRHAAVGLALAVVRSGGLALFHGHGLADIGSRTPVTQDTVFRIGSVTKTFTAIAVMQLWEQGLVDLDAPANDYLRAFRLVPARSGFRPATVRQLLTHTAGIPEVVHVADLLRPGSGPLGARPALRSVRAGAPMPTLAEYYRGRLRTVVEPGTAFAYTNHGFATLGQIVEDVSGVPLERYLRERVFEPLGMADTDLVRSARVASRLATGYALGRRGAKAVPDRDWIGPGDGAAHSTARDLARYLTTLAGGGANEHGRVLGPVTLATMFEAHYQPDPRLPGIGLAFFRHDAGGHLVVGHDGILPGFNSTLLVAPDDGVGLIALTNGSPGAMAWMPAEFGRLLRDLLGVPDGVRHDLPHHPEVWQELCGRYRFPERVSDLRGRAVAGVGVEVVVRGGRLMVRVLGPIPALYRALPLHPDDAGDPYVFRLDLSRFGMAPVRVAFARAQGTSASAMHTDLGGQPQSLSLVRRPEGRTPGFRAASAVGAPAVAGAAARRLRRRGAVQVRP